jgi:hypothetical protein
MPEARYAFVHEADLLLEPGTDPAAVGAAVTTALCGHWQHDGPCRWPHNNATEPSDDGAGFRTLFVAPATEENAVREKIEHSLRAGHGWTVLETRARPVTPSEEPLARRLAAPRPQTDR